MAMMNRWPTRVDMGYKRDGMDISEVIEFEVDKRYTTKSFTGYRKNGGTLIASAKSYYTPFSYNTNITSYYKSNGMANVTNYGFNPKGYCPIIGSGLTYIGAQTIIVTYEGNGQLKITDGSGAVTRGYFGQVFTLFVQGAGGGGGYGGNFSSNGYLGGQGGACGSSLAFVIELPYGSNSFNEELLRIKLGAGGAGGVSGSKYSKAESGGVTEVYFKGNWVASVTGGRGGVDGVSMGKYGDGKHHVTKDRDGNYVGWFSLPVLSGGSSPVDIYGTQGQGRIRLATNYNTTSRWTVSKLYNDSEDFYTTCYGCPGHFVNYGTGGSYRYFELSTNWVNSYNICDGKTIANSKHTSSGSQPSSDLGGKPLGMPGAKSVKGSGGAKSSGAGGIGAGGGGGNAYNFDTPLIAFGYGKSGGRGGNAYCIFSDYLSVPSGSALSGYVPKGF